MIHDLTTIGIVLGAWVALAGALVACLAAYAGFCRRRARRPDGVPAARPLLHAV